MAHNTTYGHNVKQAERREREAAALELADSIALKDREEELEPLLRQLRAELSDLAELGGFVPLSQRASELEATRRRAAHPEEGLERIAREAATLGTRARVALGELGVGALLTLED